MPRRGAKSPASDPAINDKYNLNKVNNTARKCTDCKFTMCLFRYLNEHCSEDFDICIDCRLRVDTENLLDEAAARGDEMGETLKEKIIDIQACKVTRWANAMCRHPHIKQWPGADVMYGGTPRDTPSEHHPAEDLSDWRAALKQTSPSIWEKALDLEKRITSGRGILSDEDVQALKARFERSTLQLESLALEQDAEKLRGCMEKMDKMRSKQKETMAALTEWRKQIKNA